MIKKLLFLATLPLLTAAALEPPPPQRDLTGGSYINQHPINLPLPDLQRMAKEQSNSKAPAEAGSAASFARPTLRNVPAAPSYRTLSDAAKAGVDPLHFLQNLSAKGSRSEKDNPYEMYYWAAGLLAFVVLAVGGFIYASRTPEATDV